MASQGSESNLDTFTLQPGWWNLDRMTFLTAWLGYLAVTAAMLVHHAGGSSSARWLASVTMLVVVGAHVGLVWGHRFGFDPRRAMAGGLAPAVLLHVLTLMILVNGLGHAHNAVIADLIYPSWGLVTLLGMPAAFLQSALAWMRLPMVVTLAGGIAGLVWLA